MIRIAAEEAWAPAELLDRYKKLLEEKPQAWDPGFHSLWGFFLGAKPRATALVRRIQDLEEERLRDMDATGIAKQLVFLTAPGVQVFDAATAVSLARDANDQLLGKISESMVLGEDQRRLIKKLYKEQVKSRGGFDAIKLTMADAGAPFSPEQVAQIQPLFDQQNEAKLQLTKQSQGQPPDKAKMDQIQRDTLSKVLKLLTAPQRAALVAK